MLALGWGSTILGIVIGVLAMVGGGVSMRLFVNEPAWALPITSYPVRHHFIDIAGPDVQYATAPIDRAGLEALVRELGMVRHEGSSPRSHDAFAPSWFRVDEGDELYVDPRSSPTSIPTSCPRTTGGAGRTRRGTART